MFEVRLLDGGGTLFVRHCNVGDLLPTIAAILQEFEGAHGKFTYQRPYAMQWRQVSESPAA